MFKKSKYGGFLKLVPKNDHIYTTVCHKTAKKGKGQKIASIKTVTYVSIIHKKPYTTLVFNGKYPKNFTLTI